MCRKVLHNVVGLPNSVYLLIVPLSNLPFSPDTRVYTALANDLSLSLSGIIFVDPFPNEYHAISQITVVVHDQLKAVLKLSNSGVVKFAGLEIPRKGRIDEINFDVYEGNCKDLECDKRYQILARRYFPKRKLSMICLPNLTASLNPIQGRGAHSPPPPR